ncbi:AMP-binding protein [Nonomuraea soli]|uniref:Fatty-acyl-CoA synthase n=1 Tax=Nonomuraea soli TaxID=1032476 RepID=A0A7W0CT21_9ACTN|nr:AMP-binding protein [Nonomuraea soli]MBA2896821.1 fatty-acyl-CoA synthase [Nonomuraea soli]
MINPADLFEHVADAVPDRLALVAGEVRLTYRALDERANRVAHWLLSQGVRRGTNVGILSWNRAEWLECMIGCFKIGAAPVNLNYRYTARELAHLLSDSGCALVLGEADLLGAVEGPRAPAFGEPYEKALALASPERDFGPRSGDDPYLLYTGGTTGLPKGVMWRQEDIFLAAMSVYSGPIGSVAELAVGAEALRFQVHAPLMHGNGQWSTWICFSAGGTVILWTERHFDAVRVLELAVRERSQVLSFAGDGMAHPVADELVRRPYPLEVFSIGSGGSPLSASVQDKIRTALPGVMIVDTFGGSETGALGAAVEGQRFRLAPGFAVLGPSFLPVGPGESGVLARSGHIPIGYLNDPEKSAATFVTGPDGVRWALQGDHAAAGDDGTAEVLGRGSMVINTGAEKVFPEEVETVVRAHPDVYDALVIGAPDPRFGQRVTAVVAATRTLTLEELGTHCRASLAGYKVPRELILVPEIRRTPVGKLDYAWARTLLE